MITALAVIGGVTAAALLVFGVYIAYALAAHCGLACQLVGHTRRLRWVHIQSEDWPCYGICRRCSSVEMDAFHDEHT